MLHTKLPIIPHRPIKVRKIPCSQNLHHSETWSGPSEAVDGHFVDRLVSWVSLAFSIFCVMFLLLSFGSWSSPMENRHQTNKSSDKAFIFWKVGILNDAYIEIQRFLSQKHYQGFHFLKSSNFHFTNCYVLHEIPLFKGNLFHCVVINCSFLSRCQGYIMYVSWERKCHLSKLSDAKKWMKYVLLLVLCYNLICHFQTDTEGNLIWYFSFYARKSYQQDYFIKVCKFGYLLTKLCAHICLVFYRVLL